MLLKIIEAKYISDYIIELTFNDGLTSKVDLKDHLHGSIFQPLLDIQEFQKFSLNQWTIEWANGADLAPEYLHDLAEKQLKELSHS